ncbi:MAG TPA: hypothetical protein VMS22_05925 [Candidatus Eisenbacteria bacterium]|nr:hypothetical protein [Candidatus Eisenbacteria bacterium]
MIRFVAAVVAVLAATDASALTVLTVGKTAVFRAHGGVASAVVGFGRDPAFATPADPTCTGGAVMTLQVAAYPQATARLDAQDEVTLPCERWKRSAGGFVYRDPDGAVGGVRKVAYSRSRFVVQFEGGTYRHVAGPVGYAELWIDIAGERLVGRFHNFRKNTADLLVARKPSAAAAAGEAAFWDVLHANDDSPARQDDALRELAKAAKRDRKDGWSRFLIGMMHLYRFAQATTTFDQVSDQAETDLAVANDAFHAALPLLWDGAAGDSRVPGFAAAAKFALGTVRGDGPLQAAGLADLEVAIDVNRFFNVFDLIPVAQATPPGDPRYAQVLARLDAYLSDPDTPTCFFTQPEICGDAGLAPRNAVGALVLFGDLYAKGGGLDAANVVKAESWYGLANNLSHSTLTAPGYRFQSALDARVGHAQERADLYQDSNPSNDPAIVGAAHEACAVCHYK